MVVSVAVSDWCCRADNVDWKRVKGEEHGGTEAFTFEARAYGGVIAYRS